MIVQDNKDIVFVANTKIDKKDYEEIQKKVVNHFTEV